MSGLSYLFLDTLREITKTKGRFVTLTLLTMLGVGCFIGFRGISPSMDLWRDSLLVHQNSMDVEISSMQGFTQKQVEELQDEIWVDCAEGMHVTEGYLEDSVAKIYSYDPENQLNQLMLQSGSVLIESHQCLVEESFLDEYGYHVGDFVTISSRDFTENQFQISGTVISPLFLSSDRGNSSLGIGQADYFVYVSESLFLEEFSHVSLKFDSDFRDGISFLVEAGETFWMETLEENLEELESKIASLINLWNVEKSWQHENLIQLEINLAYAQEIVTKEWQQFQEQLSTFTLEKEEQERLRIQKLEEIYAQSFLDLEDAQIKAEATLLSIEKSIEQGERDVQLLKNGQWDITTLEEATGYQDYLEDGARLERLAYGFPFVFLIVSLILSWATMFHMVQGERVAIGTLRCLGYH